MYICTALYLRSKYDKSVMGLGPHWCHNEAVKL